ncbi:MAG: peptidoglycan editing factor PgeF [Deltaproteobacteria bacterium]|nr:peptidoglycan editing factor PgeF [Deltaproteobacteria bacterium]
MLKQSGDINYASSPIMESVGFANHGFFSRLGGISKPPFASLNFDIRDGDAVDNIEHSKTVAGRLFGFDTSRLLTINQVHGSDVLTIDNLVKDISGLSKTSADAIITNQCGIAIGVLTADCVPILLADPVKKVVGVIHAGWRGTVKTVVQKAIDTMVKQFGSDTVAILSAIGPSIGQCCYKVDEVVIREFGVRSLEFKGNEFIEKQGNKWGLGLKRANFIQLLNMGILEKNISVENLCTSCRNDLFFSYRADGKITGRQLNFIMLKERV